MTSVALVGLGSIGSGMAASLIRNGHRVTAYDVDPQAMQRFEANGGTIAESVSVACDDKDVVVVSVVNAEQTRAVLFGHDGVAGALKEGGIVISCATMSPRDAESIAVEAARHGYLYVDGPVSGGAVKAMDGQLTFMASGCEIARQRAAPVLSAMAETIHWLGDRAGIGSSFKIVNQLLAGVHIAAACEAMTFASRMSLDLNKVYEVIKTSAGNSWMFENRVPHILAGDYSPKSAVNIFTKDLGIVTTLSRELDFPVVLASSALQLYTMTAASGMGGEDDASVARLLALISGVELPARGSE